MAAVSAFSRRHPFHTSLLVADGGSDRGSRSRVPYPRP